MLFKLAQLVQFELVLIWGKLRYVSKHMGASGVQQLWPVSIVCLKYEQKD